MNSFSPAFNDFCGLIFRPQDELPLARMCELLDQMDLAERRMAVDHVIRKGEKIKEPTTTALVKHLLSSQGAISEWANMLFKIALDYSYDAPLAAMLEAGANPDTRSHGGNTALCMAAFSGRKDLVEQLLRHGADANAKDEYESTALFQAVSNGDGKLEIVQLLVNAGADVNAFDDRGRTPLNILAADAEIIGPGNTPYYPDLPAIFSFLVEKGARLFEQKGTLADLDPGHPAFSNPFTGPILRRQLALQLHEELEASVPRPTSRGPGVRL